MSKHQDATVTPVPFIDLQAQRRRIGPSVDAVITRVLEHGRFIMGPEVGALEDQLAAFSGVSHSVSCASGTDALLMALMAWGVGPGDAVLVPSFTFAASAEVVALLGATVVFVDVEEETFNISVESVQRTLDGLSADLSPRVVMAVDMFGLPADYRELRALCSQSGLHLLADAAQSYGGSLGDEKVGALGDVSTTSFFPAKPLGCYGDGGAIFTGDADTAAILRSIRGHGQGSHKYENVRVGINGRLDTIQAAILLEKLTILQEEIDARQVVAARYSEGLRDLVRTPQVPPGRISAWAQYTICVPGRDGLAEALKGRGVPTAVYYPKPLHLQPAYSTFPRDPLGLAVSETLSDKVISLPMHPYLEEPTQERIVHEVRSAVG